MEYTASARANSNIAFIKYWGNRDDHLRLPINPSLSMNLDGLTTETTVTWDDRLPEDHLVLNGTPSDAAATLRASRHMDVLRTRLNLTARAHIESVNNFPTGAGIASSASAFAALTVAALAAAGATIDERELSTLARRGSGSASRSIPDGFVEWCTGDTHEESYAFSIAPANHWRLVDLIAIVSRSHKQIGSSEGHQAAPTSDLQNARVAGAGERLVICKQAIHDQAFDRFASVVEMDSNLMHAVMMTSNPPLFYWQPGTLAIIHAVRAWRAEGIHVCYTIDAGANVHCLCLQEDAPEVERRLRMLTAIDDVLKARTGGGAVIIKR